MGGHCYEALLQGAKVNSETTRAIWEQDLGLSINADSWTVCNFGSMQAIIYQFVKKLKSNS